MFTPLLHHVWGLLAYKCSVYQSTVFPIIMSVESQLITTPPEWHHGFEKC